ncbi:MAG TPA: ABC transporter ATP-binding protein [Candidatus Acidoferrum sp.]|nr:ABC transporter ATP-binding protein [Candidatus Acidoferrum sp.]
MPLLEVSNLSKDFGGLRAVSRLSFVVEEGEILGLIGPNGAGKTTVFNLITGFLRPSMGEIRLAGASLVGLRPHAVTQRGVARTFQIVKPFPKLSVRENVTLAAFMRLPARRVAEAEACRMLDQVGLSAKQVNLASDLTLAEQKRLEIARALATRPRLLLLDEPMGGLNPTEVEDASALVAQLCHAGVTVILVEHVMRAIMRISHRVVVIHHGEKIADDSPERVVRDPEVIAAYLGERVA